MKKIKCFLMLSLIVILAAGVFTGCSVQAGVDPSVTPHKVTYCANGGNFSIDANNVIVERYFYMQDGVLAHEPYGDSNIIKPATNSNYKFLGWAKGKVDANGNPVFRSEPINATDGGVLVSASDGPVSEAQAEVAGDAELMYYDYEDYETEGFWDFSKNLVTENVVLVAIWGEYNKYIIAEKNAQGEWNDYSDLLNGNVAEDEELAAKYEGKLYDVTQRNGVRISNTNANTAYEQVKTSGHTLIGFYKDPTFAEELNFPIDVSETITIIYPLEVEGDYARVDDAKMLQDAISKNKNIYMVKDINAAGSEVTFNNRKYTGIIKGNGHKIEGIKSTVVQTICTDEQNYYGGLFGALEGAELYDVTINVHVAFEIAINPSEEALENKGSALDALCYVGVFAKSMVNCKLVNVTVNVEYEVTRMLIFVGSNHIGGTQFEDVYEPNDYEVDVEFIEEWSALEGEGNVIGEDCSLEANEYVPASSDEEVDE